MSVQVTAVLRQCARGSGERGSPEGTPESADGQSLLAAQVGLNQRTAVTQVGMKAVQGP